MKHLLIASVILLAACGEPQAVGNYYAECMGSGADSAVTMRYMAANNIKFAKEIREDAKECLVSKGSSNDKEVIEQCSRYAHEINGGLYPGVKVWEYGFSYSGIYSEALECEKFK